MMIKGVNETILASDLRVRSQSYLLFVLTRKCDRHRVSNRRILCLCTSEAFRSNLMQNPSGPSEQRNGIFQGLEYIEYAKEFV
jgi:hypothetical protein